jgi:hypothetical protein
MRFDHSRDKFESLIFSTFLDQFSRYISELRLFERAKGLRMRKRKCYYSRSNRTLVNFLDFIGLTGYPLHGNQNIILSSNYPDLNPDQITRMFYGHPDSMSAVSFIIKSYTKCCVLSGSASNDLLHDSVNYCVQFSHVYVNHHDPRRNFE